MKSTPSGYFRSLRILHNALLVGILIFAIVVFILVRSGRFPAARDTSLDRILQSVTLLIAAVFLVAGFLIFKRRIMQGRQSADPAFQKLRKYRTACITWWVMIESPGIVALMGFLQTGNYAFFALACLHIIVLAVFMPRKDNIIILLNLNSDEVRMLEELGQSSN